MTTVTPKFQDSDADVLREQVELRKGPSNETIVVFEYCYDLTGRKRDRIYYTFVAIYIERAAMWYVTGQGGGVPRESQHDAFMKVLASANVRKASVVTEYEQFKP